MTNDSTDGIPSFLLKDQVVIPNNVIQADLKLHARLSKSDKIARALLAYYEKGNPITFSQKHEAMVRALMAAGVSDV